MNKKERLKIFILLFVLAGIYVLVFGDSGLLKRIKLEKNIDTLVNKIDKLKVDRQKLKALYEKYRNGEPLNKDIIESGYINKEGKLVFIKGLKDKRQKGKGNILESVNELKFIKIRYLQIIWIIFSVIILSSYLIVIYKKKKE